jgi:hypothetical protein
MCARVFRGDDLELTVDDHPLRSYLIANGFAWAASSYSSKDYNAGDGVRDTHRLTKVFRRRFERPDATYMTGASMGGHITARSMEQYPGTYDGALAICGALGDYELFDYFLDYNLAAQQLGLGESDFPFDGSYITTDVSAIKRNLEAAPGGWPGVLNATVRPSSNWVEPRSGGDRPNFDEAWNYWNSVPSDAGDGNFLFGLVVGDGTVAGKPGVVSDNTGVKYQLDLDPRINRREARFNRDIERVRADWRLRTSLRLNPIPVVTGRIHDPMLTLHNLGDLFVPLHNEIEYAKEVARQGTANCWCSVPSAASAIVTSRRPSWSPRSLAWSRGYSRARGPPATWSWIPGGGGAGLWLPVH